MFSLEKIEKFLIIFLLAALLAGVSLNVYDRCNRCADVKIKSFDYKPSGRESFKININKADERTLAELDGIGPSLAKRITAYRSERGGFGSVEELKEVRGIGNKLFEKIEDEVSAE